ncbi:PduO protein [Mycolicibacterium litorale]|uniref:PduO protein n=2 Tax=Mycolicibacterium litorale TaxID=758802 RepID=A0A6S6P3S0_9MYCO|nr:PduO protein [Mycolicibacterium litorale]
MAIGNAIVQQAILEALDMNRLPLKTATEVVEAAIAKADEIGQPMNIAVVDDGGHLVAFARMDGAIKASIDISIRKARTSIMMNLPTSALTDVAQPGAELYGLEQLSGGMVLFGGGLLLQSGGEVVGAIGVSAGSVEQDVQVAEAGAAVVG